MTIKELRQATGLSAQKFGDKYNIPMRTIQNWEYGKRECPDYVLQLLEFKVKYDYGLLPNQKILHDDGRIYMDITDKDKD